MSNSRSKATRSQGTRGKQMLGAQGAKREVQRQSQGHGQVIPSWKNDGQTQMQGEMAKAKAKKKKCNGQIKHKGVRRKTEGQREQMYGTDNEVMVKAQEGLAWLQKGNYKNKDVSVTVRSTYCLSCWVSSFLQTPLYESSRQSQLVTVSVSKICTCIFTRI